MRTRALKIQIKLVDLTGDTISILNNTETLDIVDETNAKDYSIICSKATDNKSIDLTGAIFHRVYDDKTHSICVYPQIMNNYETLVNRSTNELCKAFRICKTNYYITEDNQLKSTDELALFSEKYEEQFYTQLGKLVPIGRALYVTIDDNDYIFAPTTFKKLFPYVTYHRSESFDRLYDLISGKTIEMVICENVNKYVHKKSLEHKHAYEKDYEDTLKDYIKNCSTIIDVESAFVISHTKTNSSIEKLKQTLDDMKNITYTMSVKLVEQRSYDRNNSFCIYNTFINTTYKNEPFINFTITEAYHDDGTYSFIPSMFGWKITYEIKNPKLTATKLPNTAAQYVNTHNTKIENDNIVAGELNNRKYTIDFIKSTIDAAKTKLNKKTKSLSFTEYDEKTSYAFAYFGSIPGVVFVDDTSCYFHADNFKLGLRTGNQSDKLITCISMLSGMTEDQAKNYIVDYINSRLYKILNDSETIAKELCKLAEKSFNDDDGKSLKDYPEAYKKYNDIFIKYSCESHTYIGYSAIGKILRPSDLKCKGKKPNVRLLDVDGDKYDVYDIDCLMIALFNDLNIKHEYVYPVIMSATSADHVNNSIVSNHAECIENLIELIKIQKETANNLGNCNIIDLITSETEDCSISTYKLFTKNLKFYMLELVKYKKQPLIRITLKSDFDSNVCTTMELKGISACDFDISMLDRIAKNMVDSTSIFDRSL